MFKNYARVIAKRSGLAKTRLRTRSRTTMCGVTRSDWPLGPALRAARERAGLSVRAAARRTNKAISSGRWYQLESGYQKAAGQSLPIGTTAATVAAAAKAVDWDVSEALEVAGFDERDYQPAPQAVGIKQYSDDELLNEVLERMKGLRHDLEAAETARASAEAEAQEALRRWGNPERWAPGTAQWTAQYPRVDPGKDAKNAE